MSMHAETEIPHVGLQRPDPYRAVVAPIYQSTAFEFDSCDDAAALFALDRLGPLYARNANPTTEVLERRLTVLEGGRSALAFASGKAAILASILNLAAAGDNIVAASTLYGGTYALFTATLRRMGVEVRMVDSSSPENFVRSADAKTRAFYGETLSNPLLKVFPIEEIACAGRKLGIPTLIDNTLAPTICQPLRLGAAVTLISCSKFVGGHGACLGGAMVEGDFPWQSHASRFPIFSEADLSYGGVRWVEIAQRHGVSPYSLRARMVVLRDTGATMSPQNAATLAMGTESLHIRMARHCENALRVAQMLRGHPAVARVFYPYPPAEQLLPQLISGGGMVGLELKGGLAAGRRFIESLKIFRHVANNGDCRSLAIHPASTMLAQVGRDGLKQLEVSEGFVRLSVGIEHPDDLANDIHSALDVCGT